MPALPVIVFLPAISTFKLLVSFAFVLARFTPIPTVAFTEPADASAFVSK